MDSLLGLCNLHAEGPRTLRLLERRGVRTTEALLALPVERLAELLGGSPTAARRFRREVAFATQRGALREPEESAHTETHSADFTPRARVRTELRAPPTELDIDVTARPRPNVAPPASRALPRPAEPARAPVASDLLRPGLLAGLDVRTCECLVAEGVRTFAQLASAPPERLATLAGLPLALVTGLCADAARCTGQVVPPRALERVTSPRDERVAAQPVDRVVAEPRVPEPVVEREHVVEWTPAPRRALPTPPRVSALVDVAGPFASDVELIGEKDWLAARER